MGRGEDGGGTGSKERYGGTNVSNPNWVSDPHPVESMISTDRAAGLHHPPTPTPRDVSPRGIARRDIQPSALGSRAVVDELLVGRKIVAGA